MTLRRILVAPDKFKGSLPAAVVAGAVADGLRTALPGVRATACPIADGGDGTVAAAVAAGFDFVPAVALGPTGTLVRCGYARRGDTAVIELAAASGLSRLPGRVLAPMTSSTRGAGDLIALALDGGCRRIVLGLGGSASTDGGAGMLTALGVRLRDRAGDELPPGGGALRRLARIDLDGLDPRVYEAEFVIAGDVDNPLLGTHGAAAGYGPQKGASHAEVAALESGLCRFAELVGTGHADTPGAGAAGGAGFAALAVLGARLRTGIDVVMELTGFAARLAYADLVITGEGSLDAQTLRGKAPAGVARAAAARGVPVIAVAGQVALSREALARYGFAAAYALTDIEPSVARCLAYPRHLLRRLGAVVGRDLAVSA